MTTSDTQPSASVAGISGGLEVRDYLWRQFSNDDLPPPRGFASGAAKQLSNRRGKTLFEMRDKVVGAFREGLDGDPNADPVEVLANILRHYGFEPSDVRRQLVMGCAGVPTGQTGSAGRRSTAPRPTSGLMLHELVALLPG